MRNNLNRLVVTAAGVMTLGQAQAAALDFSSITSAVDISTVAAAMIALGAIMILPSVAKWAAKKLGTFFG